MIGKTLGPDQSARCTHILICVERWKLPQSVARLFSQQIQVSSYTSCWCLPILLFLLHQNIPLFLNQRAKRNRFRYQTSSSCLLFQVSDKLHILKLKSISELVGRGKGNSFTMWP
ncbi:hypothetical protein GHT06_020366 [Daphnia sinensis]|uniref:Uncharacterized protein n=1 Tax=Daphnia sinensis TaxID=1820382 RepID=A0AAD5KLA8_9CRUS|nr:hypothetical protein GHT06_020366 [Daphnia sinensis]